MKAMTICQPYTELILCGKKLVENRTWEPPRSILGQSLLLHAGKSRSWLELDATGRFDVLYKIDLTEMQFGCLVGICELSACASASNIRRGAIADLRYLSDHEHVEGPYCWVLTKVRRFAQPLPYRGALGFFEVEIPSGKLQDLIANSRKVGG